MSIEPMQETGSIYHNVRDILTSLTWRQKYGKMEVGVKS